MKTLLSITAVFECLTGIALIAIPSAIVPMLLGIPFDDDRLHVITGITGAALISIAIACWLLRNSGASALAIVKAVLCYNVAGTLILLFAILGLQMTAIGLWPVTIIHFVMGIWCLVVLFRKD
ncbi:MAG TPA: hypothetical protein VLA46_12355 [Saprospiraceae bacterium]|nr:hypothetical protein [Saprospiraceae bacterium]